MDKRRSVSNAMMASLGVTDMDKQSSVTINREDATISKYAGMYITEPTYENIEEFTRKYILNELSFFPRILDVTIDILPSEMDNARKEWIREASGVVGVKLHNKVIELPFIVRDGELLPFDVIQMDGQRVPFSRENLMKLITNLDAQIQKEQAGQTSDEPYLDTEEPINPSTVPGFMQDVMQIRDAYVNRKPGAMYVTASEHVIKLDEILEKTARLKPMSAEQMDAIAYTLNKKAHDENIKELEKLASEVEDNELTRKDIKNLDKASKMNFIDAKSVAHGKTIIFPEIGKDDITMTPGIVFKNFHEAADPKISAVIISHDGRAKALSSSDKFLCIESDSVFKLPTTELRALKAQDMFFALNVNDMFGPFSVQRNETLTATVDFDCCKENKVGDLKINNLVLKSLQASDNIYSMGSEVLASKKPWTAKKTSVVFVEGKKFEKVNYSELTKQLATAYGVTEDFINLAMPKHRVYSDFPTNNKDEVMCSDEHSKVFKIKGTISNYVQDKTDFDNFCKLAATGHDLMEKEATTAQNIMIQCVDRKQKLYNVMINYRDTDSRFMNAKRQNFNRISEGKLKAFLHILKFNGNTVKEIVFKAKNEPRTTYPLPFECKIEDIQKIEGGMVTNMSQKHVRDTVSKLVNPQQIALGVSTAMIGGLLTDSLSDFAKTQKGYNAIKAIQKFANTSQALSVSFEKLAATHESETYLDYAKLMATSYHLMTKTACVINDTQNVYPDIITVAKDIKAALPLFEKTAYDLSQLRINKDNTIDPNYVQASIEVLDNMYKVACGIENGINKDVSFTDNAL